MCEFVAIATIKRLATSNELKKKSLIIQVNTCDVSIVLLQFVGLDPLVATLLVNMNFMVIWADGNFCMRKR